MSKKLFRSIMLLVALAVLMIAIIIKFDAVISVFATILTILTPVFVGIVIAFILYPLSSLFEKLFSKIKSKKKEETAKKKSTINWRRVISMVISYILFILFVLLIFILLIPQISASVVTLSSNMNGYMENLENFLKNIAQNLNMEEVLFESTKKVVDLINDNISAILTGFIPQLFSLTLNLAHFVANIVIGLILSVYMIYDKDKILSRIKQLAKIAFKPKTFEKSCKVANITSKTFSRYIVSRFLDSFIIFVLCYISMLIFRFSYPLLISVVIGVTNIIPIFGPILGAVPSIFILLMIDPWQALGFTIFILILQQIDGNIIGPKVTGDSIGLPVWLTMISILLGGGLFGLLGMVLGVPLFGVFYKLIKDDTEKKLKNGEEEKNDQKQAS